MSRWFLGLAAFALTLPPALADDQATAVVKKAIAAHGGADALKKSQSGTSTIKGEMTVNGMDLTFTGKVVTALPDKLRLEIAAEVMGQKVDVVQVVNGAKAKNTVNGMAIPLEDAQKDDMKAGLAAREAQTLVPLLDGKRFTLKAEKDADVDGKPAAVVLVNGQGLKDAKFFFDKKTGLLAKVERKGLAPGGSGEVASESVLSDYKKVDGVMVPTKFVIHHDGKKFMTMELTETKYGPVPATEFATDD
jgi:hypothetical protein